MGIYNLVEKREFYAVISPIKEEARIGNRSNPSHNTACAIPGY